MLRVASLAPCCSTAIDTHYLALVIISGLNTRLLFPELLKRYTTEGPATTLVNEEGKVGGLTLNCLARYLQDLAPKHEEMTPAHGWKTIPKRKKCRAEPMLGYGPQAYQAQEGVCSR